MTLQPTIVTLFEESSIGPVDLKELGTAKVLIVPREGDIINFYDHSTKTLYEGKVTKIKHYLSNHPDDNLPEIDIHLFINH